MSDYFAYLRLCGEGSLYLTETLPAEVNHPPYENWGSLPEDLTLRGFHSWDDIKLMADKLHTKGQRLAGATLTLKPKYYEYRPRKQHNLLKKALLEYCKIKHIKLYGAFELTERGNIHIHCYLIGGTKSLQLFSNWYYRNWGQCHIINYPSTETPISRARMVFSFKRYYKYIHKHVYLYDEYPAIHNICFPQMQDAIDALSQMEALRIHKKKFHYVKKCILERCGRCAPPVRESGQGCSNRASPVNIYNITIVD